MSDELGPLKESPADRYRIQNEFGHGGGSDYDPAVRAVVVSLAGFDHHPAVRSRNPRRLEAATSI